ncbi:uncharacterized protein I303_107597 [Kwoniella dejecticola CBS 10117]|uniref:LCCL domain-containing protein n=1 Tax=Kwoniella dejecticola CBS 10117 TaxID=1296121 RepID=A0A1A5ZV63_9TREE|nr:uncharacterized protein I303_07608 [Kwoniella dejecticola CBS 10117]OBR81698.1 hypothetical protein I303_07608 [Kwoniella dejecticola CBS 10117]
MYTKAPQSYLRKARHVTRKLLGPSHPSQSELPPPSTSLTLSTTLGESSYSYQPDVFFRRTSKSISRWAAWIFLILWAGLFIILVRQQYYLPDTPQIIDCNAAPWDDWPPDVCGINGGSCEHDLSGIDGMSFRCLGGCANAKLGNSRYIGAEEINGQAVIVGGGDGEKTYRADSWLCPAAIHSRTISSALGGCVNFHALPYPAGFSNYKSSVSNGLNSAFFEPSYSGAYRISSFGASNGCLDLHYIVTGFNAFCLLLTTLSLRPPASLLFTILLVMGYFHLTLFADPPNVPPNWETIIGGTPAVLLAGYWFWKVSFQRALLGFKQLPLEIGLWQGIGFWLGIESSTIFSKLPITRLGYDALDPAGVISLVCIIIVAIIVVIKQAWEMRKYGLLQYYLIRYIPLIPILIILAFIPNYTIRLHHYLFAIIAMPVLSLPNRISLFGQAFALGLFLDGVGRWNWDGLIQLTGSLVGDANHGSFVPSFWSNLTSSTTLYWDPISSIESIYNVTGYSVIIDDLQQSANYTTSSIDMTALNLTEGIDHYLRLAFIANGTSLDFTDPIVWYANGSWSELWDVTEDITGNVTSL